MTMRLLCIFYAAIAICTWPVTTGIFFAEADAIYSCQSWAEKRARSMLGNSMALGAAYAALWPVTVPLAFMLTGFAEHGIRYTPMPAKERTIIKNCPYDKP